MLRFFLFLEMKMKIDKRVFMYISVCTHKVGNRVWYWYSVLRNSNRTFCCVFIQQMTRPRLAMGYVYKYILTKSYFTTHMQSHPKEVEFIKAWNTSEQSVRPVLTYFLIFCQMWIQLDFLYSFWIVGFGTFFRQNDFNYAGLSLLLY